MIFSMFSTWHLVLFIRLTLNFYLYYFIRSSSFHPHTHTLIRLKSELKFVNYFLFIVLRILDYLDSSSATSPVNLSGSASNDISFIQIINGVSMDNGCISPNLSTFGGSNSPYKIQKQLTTTNRDRKRIIRSAPNG